jgi:hypothetical protein
MQTVGAVAEGDGEASGCFEATLGALAALREGLTEERSLLRRYKALTWGRVLSPMQVRRRGKLSCVEICMSLQYPHSIVSLSLVCTS